jgi:hypothetical protein
MTTDEIALLRHAGREFERRLAAVRVDQELVEAVWAQLAPMAPFIARTGVFGVGPSGEVGEDAPLQVRVLDLSGRRP